MVTTYKIVISREDMEENRGSFNESETFKRDYATAMQSMVSGDYLLLDFSSVNCAFNINTVNCLALVQRETVRNGYKLVLAVDDYARKKMFSMNMCAVFTSYSSEEKVERNLPNILTVHKSVIQ